MGENIQIKSEDGFELGAYVARPSEKAKGGILVIQEIFGVNSHIREVTDGYAKDGYLAVAPMIFDRVDKNIELGYEEADMGRGIELAFQKLHMDQTLSDLQAAIGHLKLEQDSVGVVGYCFGGLLTWLSACDLEGVDAAVSYYGGGVVGQVEKQANCPVMMHFGELDAHIPMTDVAKIKDAQPKVQVFSYDADHGFNCDHRASFNESASEKALARSLEFFAQHVAQ
jgi:carboxymethylenebutenolidase